MKKKLLLLLIGLSANYANGIAQIVDDSTQQKYGPKTVRFFLEKDLMSGKRALNTLDTSLNNTHDTDDILYHKPLPYKNLGNWGTAAQPLFFALPQSIGMNYGVDIFTPYQFNASETRYFNTFSPYSYAHYFQGGFGRQMLRTGFHRNLSRRLVFGFDYQRLTSQKQIGVTRNRDPEASHHSAQIAANYVSANGKYIFAGNYTHLNHFVYETGGIRPNARDYKDGQLQKDSLFDFKIELVNLSPDASNRDLRNKWHIYQQYTLDSKDRIQAFYLFERGKQTNRYQDPKPDSSRLYPANLDTMKVTTQENFYTLMEQKAGFKGVLGNLHYTVFYRRKDFTLTGNRELPSGLLSAENFVGANVTYRLPDSSSTIYAEAEMQPSRDRKFKLTYQNSWLEVGGEQMHYAPTIWQTMYVGKHFTWHNPDFQFTTANHFWANANIQRKNWRVSPFVDLMSVKNYIYYGRAVAPQQDSSTAQLTSAGVQLDFVWNRWHFNHTFRYTHSNASAAATIRVPDKFVHLRYYYENALFKNALVAQFGVDMRWRSTYFGDAYMPATQQFYLQDGFGITPYMVTDLFVSARIKRVKIFFKLNNITQGIGSKGYFIVPYYNGARRFLDFGLIWQFFD